MGNNTIFPGNRIHTVCTLLDLETELLVEILAYLPPADMASVQRTCRTIRDIVAGTSYLQYILHAKINCVDDLLPPNFPHHERLKLLRRHEQSWRDLQFYLFTESHSISDRQSPHFFTLQGGHLIYQCLPGRERGLQYGYTDLCSAERNEELRWVHLTMGESQYSNSTTIVFAVDHDLLVAVSNEKDTNSAVLVRLEFFEFSTGTPHPLATTHAVSLPPLSDFPRAYVITEVLGDHILITIWNDSRKASIFLASWKTGTVTLLRVLPERPPASSVALGRLLAMSINSSLVSLVEDYENRIEICKLELDPVPRLQTLCFLELPPLASGVSNFILEAMKEWVPTSKSYARSRSSRRYHLPFYSSAIGTIALRFQRYLPVEFVDPCVLVINVPALISVLSTYARKVPWEDWGPSCTHLFKLERTGLTSVGPFWIPDLRSPIMRQYDLRRTRYTKLISGTKSSLSSRPPLDLMKGFQYDIKTHLPYDNVVMKDVDSYQFDYIVADREWFVGIGTPALGATSRRSLTVYYVG